MKFFSKIKKPFIYLFSLGLSLFLLFFVVTSTWIGYDVKSKCRQAKLDYSGTCTQALSSLLKDENRSFSSRNSAIWALGQLGDSSSLPVLQNFYTGYIPDREPFNEMISQYELKKAIKLVDGGTNITAIFWRYNLN
ncbi:MAG: HEAT repeat domain-containing protein [Candidatus Shapirobacteria bacterium]